MTKTFRKDRDYKKVARDGSPWRGCGEKTCPYCSDSRQNKKIKETIRAYEILHEELI